MSLFTSLRSLATSLFHRHRMEHELEEEFRSHMESRAADLQRSGMARAEAERRARIEFGGHEKFREECREAAGTYLFDTLLQDLRFGLRLLRKSPGFTAIAVITLALGTGATAAIFSVVYAALLRPLPYWQPNRLITLSEARSQNPAFLQFWNASYPDYLDWTRQSKTFQSLAGFSGDGFILRGTGDSRVVFGAQATTNLFSTLGVTPMLGRNFAAGEDVASGPKVAILTYAMWQSQFGGDRNVIGRSIQLDANSVTIIGVLPRQFEFAPQGTAGIWVPLHLRPNMATRRNLRWIRVIGRLAPGATPAQARAEMNTINSGLTAAYPKENGAVQVVMVPLRDRIIGNVQPLLLVLFAAAGFVLLIACANVANLLMARATGRRKELSIRATLGAGQGRLISQLLSESLMLSAAGAALGFLISRWGTTALIAAIPERQLNSMPYLRDAHANVAVLGFLCGAAIVTALVFGLAPAWQVSRESVNETLKEEGRTSPSRARARLRSAFVIVEVAFCLVLLAGATLMVKSLGALLHRDPGFDPRNLLGFSVNLPADAYPKDPDAIRFDREFTARLGRLPGLAGVASTSVVPLTGGGNTIRFVIEGQPTEEGRESECNIRTVSPRYFPVMKVPLLAGRFFNDTDDTPESPQHVIVNQVWAKQYSPGANPVGKRIRFTFSPQQKYRQIVGVVSSYVDAGLDGQQEAALFLPFAQSVSSFITYLLRTSSDPDAAISAVRLKLKETDPQLILILPQTMDQVIAQSPSVFLRRYPSYLIGSFAALALILATIGLYGLVSYAVSQRTREIGIRVALGARRRDVMSLILSEGARLALMGVAIGLGAGLALTQLMRSLLYGVSAYDPPTFLGVASLLVVVSVLACYVPARRAVRVDPVVALRYE